MLCNIPEAVASGPRVACPHAVERQPSRCVLTAMVLAVVVSALWMPLVTAAPSAPADPVAERAAALTAFVQPFVEHAMFDGTILVDIGGEVVFRGSFGRAHYEFDARHGADTRFRIASVSKGVTDAAVARMIGQGYFTLDTPLSGYLPQFPSADQILIRHLLYHRSGIPHTNRQPWGDGSQALALDEIIDRLAALPLDFAPGTDTAYSNGGYAVLAKVMALAGNASYETIMRRTVLDPLGMSRSGHVYDSRATLPHMASGYQPGLLPGERRHARFYAVESRPGGGSLYATADDLLAFMRGVFRDDFVPAPLRRDVMGLDTNGYLSQGRSPGFVSKLSFEPTRDMIVISLANNYAVPAGWAAALADIASGTAVAEPWPDVTPAAPGTVTADDPRIGRYRSSFGDFELEFVRSASGHLLSVDEINQATVALVPLADGGFLQPIYYQKCEQALPSRVITCRMLNGDERYTSTLTPVPDRKL
jgi:CubicO group peptidase (beta-lactamase class C family)